MPKFKPNTSSAMKKRTPYKMSGYSYPGTSPVKDHEKDKDGNIIEHRSQSDWESQSSETFIKTNFVSIKELEKAERIRIRALKRQRRREKRMNIRKGAE